jgi:hypothetical protein
VHDQQSTRAKNSFKLSSPTLRKLCLPCITARNYSRHHRHSKKTIQRRIDTTVPIEKNGVESFQRFELAPRTCDTAVHSSDYSRGNNANNIHELQSSHFEILKEETNDDTSLVKIETQQTSSEIIGEYVSTNEQLKSNENDVVGIRDIDNLVAFNFQRDKINFSSCSSVFLV